MTESDKISNDIVVLLDAHALLHRGFHAMKGFATKEGRPTGAIYGLVSMVLRLRELYHPRHIVACFDLPKPTFRHVAYKEYKGTRQGIDEALLPQIKEAPDVCQRLGIPVYSAEGFEADDILGTLSVQLREKGKRVIIASGDMDTLQLVHDPLVSVFTLRKGSDTALFDEGAVEGKYGFAPERIPDYKGLAGDQSDNIIGVPGIGDKTATLLIKEFGTVENIYKVIHDGGDETIKKAGVTERILGLLKEHEDEALFSKTLATIRRDAPVTFEFPEKSWEESLVKEDFEALCDEFEFRQFKGKLRELSGTEEVQDKKEESKEVGLSKRERSECQVLTQLLHSEMTNPDEEAMRDVAEVTSLTTAKEALLSKVKEAGLLDLYHSLEEPLIPLIEEMQEVGISVKKEALATLSVTLHKKVKELEKKIYEEAGEEFVIASPKQLSVLLYDKLNLGTKIKKTATGARTTNAKQLDSMVDEHAIVPLILEYRELTKLLSTYIDTLPTYIKEDGRIHAHFVQTGAGTGRFSCEDPNLQNLPVKGEYGPLVRSAFIAAPGKKLISCDYAQIDLRSAAILSGDTHLRDIFERGVDVHLGTAAKMFHIPESDITNEERRKAKAINFGILYGMGVTALKEGMGVERKEAQDFFDTYKETFVRLMQYLEEVKAFAWKFGYTATLLGRRREVPLLRSPLPYLRAQGERIAMNAPIQGTSADIIKLGMLDAREFLIAKGYYGTKASLLLQIHDEIIFEADEDVADEVAEGVKEVMKSVLAKRGLSDMPLELHTAIGDSLGDL